MEPKNLWIGAAHKAGLCSLQELQTLEAQKTELERQKAEQYKLLQQMQTVNAHLEQVVAEREQTNAQLIQELLQGKQREDALAQELYVVKADQKNKAEYIDTLHRQIYEELRPQVDRLRSEQERAAGAWKAERERWERSAAVMRGIDAFCATADSAALEGFFYSDLLTICDYQGERTFCRYRDALQDALQAQLSASKKVRVALVYTLSATWGLDSLYRALAANERFEPFVLVLPPYGVQDAAVGFAENLHAVKSAGYVYQCAYNLETNAFYTEWEKSARPDVVFTQVPYPLYPAPWNAQDMPLSVLNAMVPYGFYITSMSVDHFSLPAHRCQWRYFADTQTAAQAAQAQGAMRADGVKFSGLPKMDDMVVNVPHSRPKIIWAPHHSLPGEASDLRLATFDQNRTFFLQLAKKHTEIDWVFRPHPLLGERCVQCGVCASGQEYADYVAAWRAMPNAAVSLTEDMEPIFAASDAMILDSIGFMAEYFYYGKPLLRLVREGTPERLNALGRALTEHSRHALGTDFAEIERFVEQVARQHAGAVPQRSASQEALFRAQFDYRTINGLSAGAFIAQDLSRAAQGEE